jgi:hypothetical protein
LSSDPIRQTFPSLEFRHLAVPNRATSGQDFPKASPSACYLTESAPTLAAPYSTPNPISLTNFGLFFASKSNLMPNGLSTFPAELGWNAT